MYNRDCVSLIGSLKTAKQCRSVVEIAAANLARGRLAQREINNYLPHFGNLCSIVKLLMRSEYFSAEYINPKLRIGQLEYHREDMFQPLSRA